MSRTLIAIVGCLINVAYADQPKNLEATMGDVAKDLASLQRDVELASPKPVAAKYSLPALGAVKLTGKRVPVYKGATETSGVVTTLSEGQVLPIVDKAGEWYAVQLDQQNVGYKSGWVNASLVVPERYLIQASIDSTVDVTYQKIMAKVKEFREKYQNNPYVRVTGFSVDVSISPSVSISFEFK